MYYNTNNTKIQKQMYYLIENGGGRWEDPPLGGSAGEDPPGRGERSGGTRLGVGAYLRESGLPRQRLSTGKRLSSPAPIYRRAGFLASAIQRLSTGKAFPRQRLSTGRRPSSPAPIYRKAAFLASAYLQESCLPRQRVSTGKRCAMIRHCTINHCAP